MGNETRTNEKKQVPATCGPNLGRRGPEYPREDSMHLLLVALQDSYVGTQIWAAHALGRLGPQAGAAVPLLLDALLEARSQRLRDAAAWALSKIDPQAIEAASMRRPIGCCLECV
jgi:hypothetical protein